jgi:hypothetical protein
VHREVICSRKIRYLVSQHSICIRLKVSFCCTWWELLTEFDFFGVFWCYIRQNFRFSGLTFKLFIEQRKTNELEVVTIRSLVRVERGSSSSCRRRQDGSGEQPRAKPSKPVAFSTGPAAVHCQEKRGRVPVRATRRHWFVRKAAVREAAHWVESQERRAGLRGALAGAGASLGEWRRRGAHGSAGGYGEQSAEVIASVNREPGASPHRLRGRGLGFDWVGLWSGEGCM